MGMSIKIAVLVIAAFMTLPVPSRAARSFSEYPALAGMQRVTLRNAEGDRLDLLGYMDADRRPAVVVFPGSLCAPVFVALDRSPPGQGFATVPVMAEANGRELGVHVIYAERRNMVSLQTLSSAPSFSVGAITRLSPCSDRNGGETLEQRVADGLQQVQWVKAQKWASSVHLVGMSEGGDVAAGVAARAEPLVDSVMLVGSAGPRQFADFVAVARSRHDPKGLRNAFSDLDRFLSGTPPRSYRGYSARHWRSFALASSSLGLLQRSTVPVFLAHGELDASVPVSSADLAAVELMANQPRRPIYYWSVAGGDHALATRAGSRMWDVIREYVTWATASPSGRRFRSD